MARKRSGKSNQPAHRGAGVASPPTTQAPRPRRAPARRPLKIFASDPMRDRTPGNRVTITVPNEESRPGPRGEQIRLQPGPRGLLFHVVDYDGAEDVYYEPVDLNDNQLLMQGGLDPSEADPQFHQQMVYAVAMKVVENVERALGRKFRFKRGKPIYLLPHAFQGANAYYDPDFKDPEHSGAVLFGSFRASTVHPGENLPGQRVFTCLSHDIISHEVTHAVIDRLRPRFLDATNHDVLAFHEAIADVVAIFQHFTFPEALRDQIRASRGDVTATGLVELAAQFGWATGSGGALRRALEQTTPDPSQLGRTFEPHERGAILVAAIFDAFRIVFERRTADLRRLAGAAGRVSARELHPDLLDRLVGEATRTAQTVLTVCLRAFDYMPPVDPTFGDYLRSLVTADYELAPDDDQGVRAAMIASFRARGIYPKGVASLSQDSILHPQIDPAARPALVFPDVLVRQMLYHLALGLWSGELGALPETKADLGDDIERDVARGLVEFARLHADTLGLSASLQAAKAADIAVESFHFAARIGQDGRPVYELVVCYVQTLKSTDEASEDLGGIPVRAGTTVIASASGRIRYVIAKPFDPSPPAKAPTDGGARGQQLREFVADLDVRDPRTPYWPSEQARCLRMQSRASLRALHGRRR